MVATPAFRRTYAQTTKATPQRRKRNFVQTPSWMKPTVPNSPAQSGRLRSGN